MIRELVESERLSRALVVDAHATALSGVAVRVTPSLGTDAIVIGSIGPAFRALSSQQVLRFSSASATNLAS